MGCKGLNKVCERGYHFVNGRYVKGVPFVKERYTKAAPSLSKMVYKECGVGRQAVAYSYETLLTTSQGHKPVFTVQDTGLTEQNYVCST